MDWTQALEFRVEKMVADYTGPETERSAILRDLQRRQRADLLAKVEKSEQKWQEKQTELTEHGVKPGDQEWVRAEESMDSTIRAWNNLLESIPAPPTLETLTDAELRAEIKSAYDRFSYSLHGWQIGFTSLESTRESFERLQAAMNQGLSR